MTKVRKVLGGKTSAIKKKSPEGGGDKPEKSTLVAEVKDQREDNPKETSR